jgi:hypothetical protein
MPEPVTVWKVRLRRGDLADREGTLRLDDDALVFEDKASDDLTRLEFSAIRSAKRVRASPVMLVVHEDQGERVETAFYFSQPPPLDASSPSAVTGSSDRTLGPLAAARGSSKKRHQRENVRYLTARSGGLKPTIQAWVEAVGARTNR